MKRLWLHATLLVTCLLNQTDSVATTYLTPDEAKSIIFDKTDLKATPVTLTKTQMKQIQKASKTRVRHAKINAWKSEQGDWFILDQITGKHENIDIAVGITHTGEVKDIEILEYRETYGDQIRHPAWLAQFFGRTHKQHLKLDRDIKNISGATLSCRHVTDGINRLTQTWNHVLRYL